MVSMAIRASLPFMVHTAEGWIVEPRAVVAPKVFSVVAFFTSFFDGSSFFNVDLGCLQSDVW